MPAKLTLRDLADYFQKEANRTLNPERKAHCQRCADKYRAKAKQAELHQSKNEWTREMRKSAAISCVSCGGKAD